MSTRIMKVASPRRNFRFGIPQDIVKKMGWENATYVSIEDHWGQRLIIKKVAEDDESKEKDNRRID